MVSSPIWPMFTTSWLSLFTTIPRSPSFLSVYDRLGSSPAPSCTPSTSCPPPSWSTAFSFERGCYLKSSCGLSRRLPLSENGEPYFRVCFCLILSGMLASGRVILVRSLSLRALSIDWWRFYWVFWSFLVFKIPWLLTAPICVAWYALLCKSWPLLNSRFWIDYWTTTLLVYYLPILSTSAGESFDCLPLKLAFALGIVSKAKLAKFLLVSYLCVFFIL